MSVEKFIIMENGKSKIAISISAVKEIVPKGNIVKVPKTKDYMVGIQNIRGEIINILDVKKYLNIESETESEKIIICSFNGTQIGLLVENVNEIAQLETDEFKDIEDSIGIKDERFYSKITNYKNEPVIIGSPEKIISYEQQKGGESL